MNKDIAKNLLKDIKNEYPDLLNQTNIIKKQQQKILYGFRGVSLEQSQ